jgi:hypothetical protein
MIDGLAFFLAQTSNVVFYVTSIGYVLWSRNHPTN